jgi:exonuclease VII small subunit
VDWAALWGVLGAIGATGAFSAWLGGYFGGFLPPLPRVIRAIGYAARGRPERATPDDGRYRLALCGLEGDDAKEGTLRLLRIALNPQDYPMLHVTLSARCIRLGPWYAGKDATAGAAKADRVLREYGADAVLWGEVPKQGDSLRFFLRGAGRQETQIILFDKGMAKERPDGAFGAVLAAIALSQIVPVTEESGHYLASRLRPVAARLKSLLAEPRLVPTVESGNLHHALGMALKVIGEQAGNNPALEEAVAAYSEALKERTRERVPLDWAMTQNNLGNVLSALGERESGTTRLEAAVAAYNEALKEWTRERVPSEWATTQNNLGIALSALGERESGTTRLEAAVAVYNEALKERTRERVPLDWAMTQDILGNALLRLGERESGTTRLEAAVAAYNEALKERTRERVPLDWAMTQNNLGNALLRLGERESGTALLEAAVAAWDASLTVTETVWPAVWVQEMRSHRDAIQAEITRRRAMQ